METSALLSCEECKSNALDYVSAKASRELQLKIYQHQKSCSSCRHLLATMINERFPAFNLKAESDIPVFVRLAECRLANLLYVHASANPSPAPLIDSFTRKMTAAFRNSKVATSWLGYYTCLCGARSSNCDYRLPNGIMTNFLCVHYLAHHRNEVSTGSLREIEQWSEEKDPSEEELQGPAFILAKLGKNPNWHPCPSRKQK